MRDCAFGRWDSRYPAGLPLTDLSGRLDTREQVAGPRRSSCFARRLMRISRPISSALTALTLMLCQTADSSAEPKNAWVLVKPGAETQVQKSVQERGGINPCMTEDPGFGAYEPWRRGLPIGQLLAPRTWRAKGAFDVVFHFHGHEAARKEWVRVMDGPVLVGIDLGNGSGPYDHYFSSPDAFRELVAATERVVAGRMGVASARVRRIGLSSWSAGYGAISRILTQKHNIDSVVLLDGLHSGYDSAGGTLNPMQLGPFSAFAKEAAARKRLMYVTHSSIIPPGYASTTETSNYLISEVGGRPRPSKPRRGDRFGLDLISWFVKGGFHVRGYAGNGPADHCAQFGAYGDVLRIHLARRWRA